MHRNVESSLEETLSVLKRAKDLHLLQAHEIRVIIKKRRDLEYGILRSDAYSNQRKKYLEYVAFEKEVTKAIKSRLLKKKTKLQKKQKLKQAHVLAGRFEARVNFIYSRALRRLQGDTELWLHYIHHCIERNMVNVVQHVLIKALAVCGHDYRIWLKAMSFHFDNCNDTRTARSVAQRALRMLPDCTLLWLEYFKLELYYLIRLTMRRFAMGISPDDHDQNEAGEQSSNKEETNDVEESEKVIGNINDEADMKVDNETSSDSGNQKLSFWMGGVSLAVFKAALKKLSLTQVDCIQFYRIASECPLVPSALLSAMVRLLNQSHEDIPITQLLNERVKWDCAKVELDRKYAKLKSDAMTKEEKAELGERKTSDSVELIKQGKDVLSHLLTKVQNTEQLRIIDSKSNDVKQKDTKESSRAFVKNFTNLLDDVDKSEFTTDLSQLGNTLVKKESDSLVDQCRKGPTDWDSKTLLKYLRRGYDELNISTDDLANCVRRLCLVPFRSKQDDDDALCAYLNRDLPPGELQEIFKFLMTNPPITLQSMTALANGMITRLQRGQDSISMEENDDEDEGENLDEFKEQIRKLFKKCTGLSEVKQDISFWITYIDFERRVAKNAKQSNMVHGQAMRIIDVNSRQHFVERLSLLSLE